MSTYTPIASITLGSAQSSVTFSNIPQTYTDLVIVMSYQRSVSGNGLLRFNSDTGSNYSYTYLLGDGSNASSSRGSNQTSGIFSYDSANLQETCLVNIFNYANTTTNKSFFTRGNDTGLGVITYMNLWRSTSAITSIELRPNSGNWNSGSTFNLYGIANASITNTAKATGGDSVTTDGTYWYHTFRSSGTFTPTQALTADYLVVAGGGGGGGGDNTWGGGGGGGGGGLRCTVTATGGGGSLESALSLTAQAYTVTVGGGGAAGAAATRGTNGTDSVFATITSTGGGAGGGTDATGPDAGATGGSGGGGGTDAGAAGSGTANQGFNGGAGSGPHSGGGGGAGAAGTAGSATQPTGGNGVSSSITGSSVTYGGGGGGAKNASGTAASGGTGGGGNGGATGARSGTAGTANTGGGGGGAQNNGTAGVSGSAGGSGIVIIRYAV